MQLGQKGGRKLNSGKQEVGSSRKLRDARKQLDVRSGNSRKASRFMDREQKAVWNRMPADQKRRLIREATGGGYRGGAASADRAAMRQTAAHNCGRAEIPGSLNAGQEAPLKRKSNRAWQQFGIDMVPGRISPVAEVNGKREEPGDFPGGNSPGNDPEKRIIPETRDAAAIYPVFIRRVRTGQKAANIQEEPGGR